jgi:hypothetical protein
MLNGERLTYNGKQINLDQFELVHPPEQIPPISLGVSSPKSLILSGRVADGIILAEYAAPAYVTWGVSLGQTSSYPAARYSVLPPTLVIQTAIPVSNIVRPRPRLWSCAFLGATYFSIHSVVRSRQSGRSAEENSATISHLDWSEAEYHEPANGQSSVNFLNKTFFCSEKISGMPVRRQSRRPYFSRNDARYLSSLIASPRVTSLTSFITANCLTL